MTKIVMYATGSCPYCVRAEQWVVRTGLGVIGKLRADLDPTQS